jgi:DNA-binding NtrC family response regulator
LCSRSKAGAMLDDKPVLIVEDNVYLALDLSQAVEEYDGRVVGPVSSVAEALALLERETIAAALLDSRLADRDVTPVVELLAAKGVPFVIHTATGLPPGIEQAVPDVPLLVEPLRAEAAVARLAAEMKRREADGSRA